jgi:hypothetical protein
MNQAVPAGAFFALIAGGSGRVLRILGISFFEIRHCFGPYEGQCGELPPARFYGSSGMVDFWWVFWLSYCAD